MIQDVVTRWGSCHDMLERAVYLRKAIDAFVKDLHFSELEISANEWTQVEFVLNILIPFKATCMCLQQTSHPSIEVVFYTYESLFNELDRLAMLADDKCLSLFESFLIVVNRNLKQLGLEHCPRC
jgi:hypothetical protein